MLPQGFQVLFHQWPIGVEAFFADGTVDERQGQTAETGHEPGTGGTAFGNCFADDCVDDVLQGESVDDQAELGG